MNRYRVVLCYVELSATLNPSHYSVTADVVQPTFTVVEYQSDAPELYVHGVELLKHASCVGTLAITPFVGRYRAGLR